MNAYSEDLRKKIVEATERGTPKTEVARAFDVGVPSIKSYVATARSVRYPQRYKKPLAAWFTGASGSTF
jgi:transposase